MTKHQRKNILICFSNTGGGHRSAAHAIKEAIEEQSKNSLEHSNTKVFLADVIESSNLFNSYFVSAYNYLLGKHQNWVKYYYKFIEYSQPDKWQPAYYLSKRYLSELLRNTDPSIVVSVHPMVNHNLARAISDFGFSNSTKLVVVITDPNESIWTGWACPEAFLTICPNDLAESRILQLGLQPSQVRTMGMPIRIDYMRPASTNRKQYLEALNLDPNKVTVCLTAGKIGGSNILQVYDELKLVKKPIQTIVHCGTNSRMKKAFERKSKNSLMPTVVLSNVQSFSDLMSASDLLITKPGGLTSFEAVAKRLPLALLMFSELMPQEEGTARLLIEANLAKPVRSTGDIVPIVESIEVLHNREAQTLPGQHSLDCVDASSNIAKLLLELCSLKEETCSKTTLN